MHLDLSLNPWDEELLHQSSTTSPFSLNFLPGKRKRYEKVTEAVYYLSYRSLGPQYVRGLDESSKDWD